MIRTGVYVCHCGLNIAGVINVEQLVQYAKTLPDVVTVSHYTYMCSDSGQRLIQEGIKSHKLNRVVVATCSPRMHEETFRKAVAEAGLNPYVLEIVNLREHVSWAHSDQSELATDKAKALVRMGVARASLLEPLEKQRITVNKDVLVIGGGIAGMQASLDLANAGFRVYLAEKESSIGGRMAQLDKTFPTLDCSACILTPKMVDVAKNPNITLLTNSTVKEAKGFVGNYEVCLLKRPRFVDESKCVGCELCVKVCPVKIPDPFNEKLGETRAISIHSAHAVPKVASISQDDCLRLKLKKDVCGMCTQACEAKAIDFEQKPQTIRLRVGAIIVAIGSKVFDASRMPEYGYGRVKNVVSNMEFERLSDASGPTGGRILSPQTGKPPRTVAFIQCAGSRDKRFHENCCRVGCMVSLKQAILAREKLGAEASIYVCYIDMRSFGKGYEEFYRRARELGIEFVSGLPSEVHASQDGIICFDVFDKVTNKLMELRADMVVLASGLVPGDDIADVNRLFHASSSADGFLLEAHPKLRPLESSTAGIFVAGVCQGPKDIPDTVAQASGAAAKVIDLLSAGELELEALKAEVDGDLCSGCRVCESVCPFVAVEVKAEKGGKLEADVVEAMCQGCGLCAASCPTGAIRMKHYTDAQIAAEVQKAFVTEAARTKGE